MNEILYIYGASCKYTYLIVKVNVVAKKWWLQVVGSWQRL